MLRPTLRRLLTYARPHREVLGWAFAAMLVLGLTNGAYAYLIGPALRFLLSGGVEGLGMAGRLLPWLGEVDRDRALLFFPVALIGLGVVKGLAYLGQFYWMGLFGQRVVMDLRRAVFAHLAGMSPTRVARELSGDLLSRFSSDVANVELAATYTLASWVRDGLQIVILAAVAFTLSWQLALAALIIVPLAVFPASRLTRAFLARTREGQHQLGALAGQVQEGLGALTTIQAFDARAAELERFRGTVQAHLRAMSRAGWAKGAVPALMELLAALAIAGLVAYGAGSGLVSGDRLVSFLAALVLLYQPAKDLGRVGQFAVQAAASGERLFALLDATHPVEDPPDAVLLPAVRGGVSLADVHFAYGDRPALRGLSLDLPVGQVTALVGASGSGKSTVASLLLRFERPHRGTYSVDGVNADAASASSVRAQFALVTQEPLLFSATVRENLRFSRPEATDEELERAARIADADRFIRALPAGYDTQVGERGVLLSGGQKQRLCLARAVLSGAPILVLDEATSNLDPESEEQVQAALRQVVAGRTALVIAHRLSAVVNADRIHVMQEGRVVESGSHAELLARGGAYAGLWTLQNPPERGARVA